MEASPTRIQFATQLRAERHRQGLSLEELADRCGLGWSYIGQVERGTRNITVDNMHALATGLGVQVGDLLRQTPLLPPDEHTN